MGNTQIADKLIAGLHNTNPHHETSDDYMPVAEIIGKYCCRKTFYKHVNSGLITLYKFGGKSFVRQAEFLRAFRPVGAGMLAMNACAGNRKGGNV